MLTKNKGARVKPITQEPLVGSTLKSPLKCLLEKIWAFLICPKLTYKEALVRYQKLAKAGWSDQKIQEDCPQLYRILFSNPKLSIGQILQRKTIRLSAML